MSECKHLGRKGDKARDGQDQVHDATDGRGIMGAVRGVCVSEIRSSARERCQGGWHVSGPRSGMGVARGSTGKAKQGAGTVRNRVRRQPAKVSTGVKKRAWSNSEGDVGASQGKRGRILREVQARPDWVRSRPGKEGLERDPDQLSGAS